MKFLEIIGSGFWNSDDIVVKFTRKGPGSIPPRSTIGKFIGDCITCKPPRLPEHGEYDISVALDGKLFINNPLCTLLTFADPTIVEISPKIVNLNKNQGNFEAKLIGSHFDSMPTLQDSIKVILRNISHQDDSMYIASDGTLLPEEHPAVEDVEESSLVSRNTLGTSDSTNAPANQEEQYNLHPHHHHRTVVSKTNSLAISSSVGDADFLSVQISLNGTDFSIPCDEHIFTHRFEAKSVSPSVLSLDSNDLVVAIIGEGIFNPNIFEYEVYMSLALINDPENILIETSFPFDWESLQRLKLPIPSIESLFPSEGKSDKEKIGDGNGDGDEKEKEEEFKDEKEEVETEGLEEKDQTDQISVSVDRQTNGNENYVEEAGINFSSSSFICSLSIWVYT
jgi:hypothetical protein